MGSCNAEARVRRLSAGEKCAGHRAAGGTVFRRSSSLCVVVWGGAIGVKLARLLSRSYFSVDPVLNMERGPRTEEFIEVTPMTEFGSEFLVHRPSFRFALSHGH